jgi:hypothetical protein
MTLQIRLKVSIDPDTLVAEATLRGMAEDEVIVQTKERLGRELISRRARSRCLARALTSSSEGA